MTNTPWLQIEAAFRELFARQWYTNQGPLACELEKRLQNFLDMEHVVCVVNSGVALTMALEALQLQGPVQLHGKPHAGILTALHWARIQLCNEKQVPSAVLSCGLKADTLNAAFETAFNEKCALILDSTQCSDEYSLNKLVHYLDGRRGHTYGPVLAVLSFQHGQAIQAQGAACIATVDAKLAEQLRNIRSSYGVRATVPVEKTANGRMSEAQAAFGLVSLNKLDRSTV